VRAATIDPSQLRADIGTLLGAHPDFLADPWPVWRSLREVGPVFEAAGVHWVSGYEAARTMLQDPARFSSDSTRRGSRAIELRSMMTVEQRSAFDEINDFAARFVVNCDGDRHDRLRRIAQRSFTPARIAALQAATARYADDILTSLAADDEADFMELAYRVPLMIIGDLLGVPDGDQQLIKDWSNVWFQFRYQPDDRILTSAQAGREFLAYVNGMIDEHRRHARDGLIAALLDAERHDRLDTDELAAMFFVLLFAGHETTTNLIGTGMLELLRRREQWERIVADPDLAPNAVEELLRFVTPVQWANRYAQEDVEVDGAAIPAGSSIAVALACANRDPSVFSDPDALDVRREEARKHVSFAFGPHFCLGAHLARLEAEITFRMVATRFPDIGLVTNDLGWRGAAPLRGLGALPVRFGSPR
jgi:cytochrome P450